MLQLGPSRFIILCAHQTNAAYVSIQSTPKVCPEQMFQTINNSTVINKLRLHVSDALTPCSLTSAPQAASHSDFRTGLSCYVR